MKIKDWGKKLYFDVFLSTILIFLWHSLNQNSDIEWEDIWKLKVLEGSRRIENDLNYLFKFTSIVTVVTQQIYRKIRVSAEGLGGDL